MKYYIAAESIMESALERFYDATGCGFFDTEKAAKDEVRLGALVTRRKPLQDSPTPAGNPVGAALLLRLEALNGREDYAVKALETLETFAGVVEHFGLYAASYGLAPPETEGWRETRIWCPNCAAYHLMGRLTPESGVFSLRCPGCYERIPLDFANWREAALFDGVAVFLGNG